MWTKYSWKRFFRAFAVLPDAGSQSRTKLECIYVIIIIVIIIIVKEQLRSSGSYTDVDRAALKGCRRKFFWMVVVFAIWYVISMANTRMFRNPIFPVVVLIQQYLQCCCFDLTIFVKFVNDP